MQPKYISYKAAATTKMSISYFSKTENDRRRWPEVEMLTGNRKIRVLEYEKKLLEY